ncbi:MAG: type II toxin-antitoxin system Phd/YefM family antitoxin [Glaciecola sp.]|jgi:prevent-host-death family protein|nr:type II toxin-antitoxin system Phd/YefM family antitoxin [Glaciecola sp.]MDG1815647.1 type II toxin-antitoxin system Phd/YefM family antitoxin [Glaciecola sp.]MDG2098166.1 type II toxin-antitoxin system Phd/YefM family antitoxin [Glaciecola sp.]
MSLLTNTKPISYLKSHASSIANELREEGEHYVITQNGEPAMVVQSVHEYEQTQDMLAMLKMIAQSEQDIVKDATVNAEDVINDIKKRLAK